MADQSFTVRFNWYEKDNLYTAYIEDAPFFLSDNDWEQVEGLAEHFTESYLNAVLEDVND